jgi:outer membrane scaffolding protein for murein synthesis (MipA/OmpV family)
MPLDIPAAATNGPGAFQWSASSTGDFSLGRCRTPVRQPDGKYRQTFFGIDAAQSLIAGVPEHTVKSGLNEVRLSIGADYKLTSKLSLGAHVAYGKLQGDAADSPVTTDKTQHSIAVFAAYRFK